MARRRKDQPFEQFSDEKAGVVIVGLIVSALIVGVFLIISGLSG